MIPILVKVYQEIKIFSYIYIYDQFQKKMVDADQRFVRGKKTTKRSIIDFRSRAFLVTLSLFRNGGNIAFSGRLVQIKQRGGMEKRKENERSRLRGKIESNAVSSVGRSNREFLSCCIIDGFFSNECCTR